MGKHPALVFFSRYVTSCLRHASIELTFSPACPALISRSGQICVYLQDPVEPRDCLLITRACAHAVRVRLLSPCCVTRGVFDFLRSGHRFCPLQRGEVSYDSWSPFAIFVSSLSQ